MPYIRSSEERNQLIMISLEGTISQNAFVRVIDAFVDAIDLQSFGFTHTECKGCANRAKLRMVNAMEEQLIAVNMPMQ